CCLPAKVRSAHGSKRMRSSKMFRSASVPPRLRGRQISIRPATSTSRLRPRRDYRSRRSKPWRLSVPWSRRTFRVTKILSRTPIPDYSCRRTHRRWPTPSRRCSTTRSNVGRWERGAPRVYVNSSPCSRWSPRRPRSIERRRRPAGLLVDREAQGGRCPEAPQTIEKIAHAPGAELAGAFLVRQRPRPGETGFAKLPDGQVRAVAEQDRIDRLTSAHRWADPPYRVDFQGVKAPRGGARSGAPAMLQSRREPSRARNGWRRLHRLASRRATPRRRRPRPGPLPLLDRRADQSAVRAQGSPSARGDPRRHPQSFGAPAGGAGRAGDLSPGGDALGAALGQGSARRERQQRDRHPARARSRTAVQGAP